MLSLEWFNQEISRYAKFLGIQKIEKYYVDGRPETCELHGTQRSGRTSP